MSTERAEWELHQGFERDYWGECTYTFGEETKQIFAYAPLMDMSFGPNDGGYWPLKDQRKKSVIDIGGGPVSMLLKCRNRGASAVVDPCLYPEWVHARYAELGIEYQQLPAEDYLPKLKDNEFDEAWCYNVLQHVIDPELLATEMRRVAGTVRVFEWIDQPAYPGHPHTLTRSTLEDWFGGPGRVAGFNEKGFPSCRPTQRAWGISASSWKIATPDSRTDEIVIPLQRKR